MYEENFNIYKAFSTAEEKLYISYSSADSDGKALRKSLIISKLKRIFPQLNEINENKDRVLTPKITFSKSVLNGSFCTKKSKYSLLNVNNDLVVLNNISLICGIII